MRNFKL